MKEHPLKGVKTYELNMMPDERGFFAEGLRKDWKELLEGEWVTQANISYSYPNIIRAWHKHQRGQIDYFLVLKGAMKICAYEEETAKMAEVIATGEKPTLVRIPGKYLHGTKTVSNEPSLTIYFVTKLYDYQNPDESRRPWNDPTIVPTEINGKKDDPRVGKPWDWFRPPHK
ncbi:MAG: dTDP-4-dehydrorhamnose 3,5-epimerase family protein [Candidatus Bathyarchaeota archaeon]|nr:dTDP-4-dehydrorhamnose 3,5-epimerase family protein [Candidatus Bathyarchaeota archaeon]MDH5624065.1 dTDP-4-dehydrorhamnose 3,5-epimerase family protein [Candidatus Bathyarchaeota archaeon]MDH5635462.1 dTDP-4-dehydrorhamnose 3,5-epimerase family protein [Candidatus Bathyarchaeota archaeon]MDH5701968.1 dTDP-4-dehydrorhamnose 3,5-epimerase family protein [Candidatus Bathyarchaeota archaeon]